MYKPLIAALLLVSQPTHASTQTAFSTQERFQDLFATAGYGTAFGAAMGAAFLSFQDAPDESLRYVAIGASLGFIGGSLLGSYIVFSPVFQVSQKETIEPLSLASLSPEATFTFRPSLDPKSGKANYYEGAFTLSRF